jgi:hypothetical protein
MPADAGPAGGATTVPRDPTQSHGTNALLSALALVSDERYSGHVKAPVVSRENSSHALRRISSHEQLAQTARHRVPFSALNLRGFSPRAAPCAASKPKKTYASPVGRRRRRARVRTRELTPEPEEPTAKRRSEPSAKRERPPHVSSSDEDSNGGAGAAEDLDPTTLEQQRKDVRRERNRQHARVSRERKRQKLEHLQEENDALRRQEAALMDQRDRINARLLRVEYENRALRAWIQNHAGDGAPPPPPAADDDEASRPVPDH